MKPHDNLQKQKLVICVWHPFTEWRPKAGDGQRRYASGGLKWRVVHLPKLRIRLDRGIAPTRIFSWGLFRLRRAEQLKDAKEAEMDPLDGGPGVAQLMYPELRDSGIMVTNPSGIFSVPMAEHTMGLLLALAGAIFPTRWRGQDRANWAQQGNLGPSRSILTELEWKDSSHHWIRIDREGKFAKSGPKRSR